MTIEVKQGDSLQLDCIWWADPGETTPVDLTGWTVAAAARHSSGQTALLTVQVSDAAGGVFALTATPTETATWPPGDWAFDVERSKGGVVLSSETVALTVREDITNG